jgi:hypothetical protein
MVRTLACSLVGVLALAAPAAADVTLYEHPDATSYAWGDRLMKSDIGVGFVLGGGIAGFTDATVRDSLSSSLAGLWDARVAVGTHIPLGVELGYIGTGVDMSTLNNSNGTLVGTAVEGTLRYNILPHAAIDPYAFAGVGWQRYDVMNMKLATSDTGIRSSDDLAEFPMGAGLSYRDASGWLVDVRGTFRAAAASTLVLDPRSGSYADLHSWEASGALGYEF